MKLSKGVVQRKLGGGDSQPPHKTATEWHTKIYYLYYKQPKTNAILEDRE